MEEYKITDKDTNLLMMLHDGNDFYLNMGTINKYDQFHPLYISGYVTPAPNNSVWYLTMKGINFADAVNASRKNSMNDDDKLLWFAFEQGIKYAKRSSQERISKFEYFLKSIDSQKNKTK